MKKKIKDCTFKEFTGWANARACDGRWSMLDAMNSISVISMVYEVKIDDLVLNAEDLYIADYLVAGYTRQIKVPYVAGVSVDTTQSNGFASKDNPDPDTRVWKQSQITYTDGLKAGDMVLVQKLNDNNKYVIIARVVEA